jgi:para-nitrobenzyl esterase
MPGVLRLPKVLSLSFLLSAYAATLALAEPSQSRAPQVATTDGTVRGVGLDGVDYFKGIPYALPPVGNLRWEPPEPVAPWKGVRNAVAYGHDCMQARIPAAFSSAVIRTTPSEDCLYLNVWRPSGNKTKLPVLVWIYGGGFVTGGSSLAVYDGTRFARDGVILVSFNYRLGRLGFFAFPALTGASPNGLLGNYGYMDQIAALKWIKANISTFGGDPNNITISGESAGGVSVHVLLSTPLASGLFDKAIIESGGGRENLLGDRLLSLDKPGLASGETIGVNFAKANGIDGVGPKALAELRALPAYRLVSDLNMVAVLMRGSGRLTYAHPMIDGKIVINSPETAYRSGNFTHVPLLIGANSADLALHSGRTMEEALALFGADKNEAKTAFDITAASDPLVVNWQVAMDKDMVEPARFAAREFSAHGVPAYEYRFSYPSAAVAAAMQRTPMGAAMKGDSKFWQFVSNNAMHGSEFAFVFDNLGAMSGANVTKAEEVIAAQMHAYWVNFAKTGDPNRPDLPPGAPVWPAYRAQTDILMNFTRDGPKVMTDPLKAQLDIVAAHAD